jgi:predicted permease
MLDILALTFPIYAVILVGFLATRMEVFAKGDMRVFGTFVVRFALPALVFRALAQRSLGEILNPGYLFAYAAGSLAMVGLGYAISRGLARQSPLTSSVYVMGISCSNSAYIGYPIVLLTLAPVAGVALALNMVVENVIMLPLLISLAERGRGKGGPWYRVLGASLVRLARNPIIIAVFAGLAASLLGVKLPAPVDRAIDLFAVASSGLSLFVIGGSLVGLPLGGLGRRAAPIAAAKLILHPLAVLLATLAVPVLGMPALDPELQLAAVLLAAMPMMSIYPILAQAYGQEDFAATALLLTTVASFFTLSGLLWIFQHIPP